MTTEDIPSNAFLAILQQKERSCGLLAEASVAMCSAAAAAERTQKKATVTLTITIEPKMSALNVKADLKAKLPPEEQPLCIFYVDKTGKLSRNDPAQSEFRFKQYEGGGGGSETAVHSGGVSYGASGAGASPQGPSVAFGTGGGGTVIHGQNVHRGYGGASAAGE